MTEKPLGKCPHCSAVLTEKEIYISDFEKYVHVTNGDERSIGPKSDYWNRHTSYTCRKCKHIIGFATWQRSP